MALLQATLFSGGMSGATTDAQLFLWAREGDLDDALERDVPEWAVAGGAKGGVRGDGTVADPSRPGRRRTVPGLWMGFDALLPLLPALAADAGLSDSLRLWGMASGFALELASRQAVAPWVRDGTARWSVRMQRPDDRARFEALVEALPLAARLAPTHDTGPARIRPSQDVVKAFLDGLVDHVYRQDAWPGPARGWTLELAEGLKSTASVAFAPRDARSQGIPGRLQAWVSGAEQSGGVRLGMRLALPGEHRGGAADAFHLSFFLQSLNEPGAEIPAHVAWRAGREITIGARRVRHPAWALLRRMARAARVFPPLARAMASDEPRTLALDPTETWGLLSQGVGPLRDAGFEVVLPDVFGQRGTRRLRARMRIEASGATGSGPVHLGEMLTYRWEVVLGDRILTGEEFDELARSREPVVRFRGEWVVLDPAELALLPEGLSQTGTLDAATALRAVLTGQHDGVPVVADARLEMVIEALKRPPERATPGPLHATLRPYQATGYAWLGCLGDLGLGACLADDMGLGKTVQLIAHLVERHVVGDAAHPSLVVCPTSLLGNWTRELRRFAPDITVSRHHGLHRDLDRARQADVVLTTYGLMARDGDILTDAAWEIVALDEAQAIKNPDSRRARTAYGLTARHKVALSGTPVENRLEELWSILHFLMPGLLGTRAAFRRNVAIPVERFGDEAVAERLKLGVSPFLMRRVKTDPDIRGDLPDKIERREYCVLASEQADLYATVAEEHLERVREASASERRGQILAMLTALKQVCNHPSHYLHDDGPLEGRSGKLERSTEILEAVLDAGERAIVFTQYREMGNRLVRHFDEVFGVQVPFLHGAVPSERRDAMVRAFQEHEDGPPILLVSLRAGGTGLNLTRATHVLHYDRWWNPAVEDQATDRAYRLGQHDNVQVYKLICQGTLEERIDQMLEDKRALAQSVVGSGERLVTELDDAALRALVKLGDDAVEEAA